MSRLDLPAGVDAPRGNGPLAPAAPRAACAGTLDLAAIRRDFPVLEREIAPGCPLAYLDSAATSLKPRAVVEAVAAYLTDCPANVHRGVHTLSEQATELYEAAREKVAAFIHAPDSAQVVFTRGTTESINLVARSWGGANLRPGDEILLTAVEHHSNLVPWQLVAEQTGAALRFVELDADFQLPLDSFDRLIGPRTRLVALTGMSNVLGTVPPVAEIIRLAHDRGALVLVDGAQSVPHQPTDVQALGADFLAFSGHKMLGPTGVGVLFARRELLEAMPPMLGGGSMVLKVEDERSTWTEIPWKFEAGTPPIAEVIGLGAAVDYLARLPWEAQISHEHALTAHATRVLGGVPGVTIHGPAPEHKGGILAFTVVGVHPHDLAQVADNQGVAIRAGHHCAMPLHRRLGLAATARASLYLYNTVQEVDRLAVAIDAARTLLRSRPRTRV